MSTISIDVEVPVINCQGPACSGSTEMIATSTYRNADGYMIANSTRLPTDWCRILKVNSDGSESPFKVYCPTCTAGL